MGSISKDINKSIGKNTHYPNRVSDNKDYKTLFKSNKDDYRKQFDTNFETWKRLPATDPQRRILADENETLLRLILDDGDHP